MIRALRGWDLAAGGGKRLPQAFCAPKLVLLLLGAQRQVELADGLQELTLQHLVSCPLSQCQLELMVDDTSHLVGHDLAVEVAQLLHSL